MSLLEKLFGMLVIGLQLMACQLPAGTPPEEWGASYLEPAEVISTEVLAREADHSTVALPEAMSPHAGYYVPSLAELASPCAIIKPHELHSLLGRINELRQAGCKCGDMYYSPTHPLRWSPSLEALSRKRGKALARMYPNGLPAQLDASNLPASRAMGEAIGQGFTSVEEALGSWQQSPNTCRALMNPAYREMGIAIEGCFWVQSFGAPLY